MKQEINDKTTLVQNCMAALEYAVDVERFFENYYGSTYISERESIESDIKETAQAVLFHKAGFIKEELQGIVDESDDMVEEAQGLIDRLDTLESQIVDTRPEVFPVPFDTFPDCDLSDVAYVLANGEKLCHCTYEPDFFMSENRLADGTLTKPCVYEAIRDHEGIPTSFRLTENVRITSEPIPARMEESAFRAAVEQLLPGSVPGAVTGWILFAEENVDSEYYVNFREEPEKVASEQWLNCIYAGLNAAKEDFGELIAGQVCNLGAIQSCLYPGDMCVAAQHLQDGRTLEDISDMVMSGKLNDPTLFFPVRRDCFQPEHLYCVTIESPYEAVGKEIGIKQEGVPYGLIERRTEPGYLLKDGTVLLECERDAYGNYQGGVEMDGMYLKTWKLYAPVVSADGQLQAFRKLHNRMYRERDENQLAANKMNSQQNNIIFGIPNNEQPRPAEQGHRPSILNQIKTYTAQTEKPFPTWGVKKDLTER